MVLTELRFSVALVASLLSAALSGPLSLAAQAAPDSQALARVDRYLGDQLEELDIPGAALVVVRSEGVVHARGYGRVSEEGAGVTPQTPFPLASVTKSITALMTMRLVESGRLELDAPVQRYLPWFRVADPDASAEITLRHLLSQTSGLSTLSGRLSFGSTDISSEALAEATRELAEIDLVAEPGEEFHYSNSNFLILGAILEAVSGRTFEELVEEEVFTPLGMTDSFTSVPTAEAHGMATMHQYFFGRVVPVEDLPYTRRGLPLGGLVSSAADLGRFIRALLNGGTLEGTRIVSAEGVRELFQPQAQVQDSVFYGLGWFVSERASSPSVFHGGDGEGFTGTVSFVPGEDWGYVLLINANSYSSGPNFQQLKQAVEKVLRGQEPVAVDPAIFITPVIGLAVLLLVQLIAAARTIFLLLSWRRHPARRPRNAWVRWGWHLAVPLLASAAVALAVLVLLPAVFEIPLRGILLFAPDVGYLVVAIGSIAIIWGIVRTVLVGWTLGSGTHRFQHDVHRLVGFH